MCDEAVANSLAALKLIPNWFVTSKMIKKLYTADVLFCCDEIGALSINLNINLDNNFDEDDPNTINLTRLLAWQSQFKKKQSTYKK